ncbi:hypothetical protein C8J57DRAFT_1242571 [Mycena rebaudengoi]|nr:hypothetical protein C8J57DRAFT_1242571 [Mycena rebaudengoi]
MEEACAKMTKMGRIFVAFYRHRKRVDLLRELNCYNCPTQYGKWRKSSNKKIRNDRVHKTAALEQLCAQIGGHISAISRRQLIVGTDNFVSQSSTSIAPKSLSQASLRGKPVDRSGERVDPNLRRARFLPSRNYEVNIQRRWGLSANTETGLPEIADRVTVM